MCIRDSDYVIMESTYGDRLHETDRPDYISGLAEVLQKTFDRGGNVVIPSFAVGRTQEILYFLRKTGKQNWEYIKSHRTISGMLLLLSIDVYKRQGNALSDGNCHGFYSRGFRQGHSGAFG